MEKSYLKELIKRYPVLKSCEESVLKAYGVLENCFMNGNKLLIAGNGGSSADGQHIVGELMKGFNSARPCKKEFADKLKAVDTDKGALLSLRLQGALPSISLDGQHGLTTAYINDVKDGGLFYYAQGVYGYGKEGDVFLGISTSGNSENVINAAITAKALNMKVIALTGETGGKLKDFADVLINVPSKETFIIQELHIPVYHCICSMLEERFFN